MHGCRCGAGGPISNPASRNKGSKPEVTPAQAESISRTGSVPMLRCVCKQPYRPAAQRDQPAQAHTSRMFVGCRGNGGCLRMRSGCGSHWDACRQFADELCSSRIDVASPVQTLKTDAASGRSRMAPAKRRRLADMDKVSSLHAIATDQDRFRVANALAEDRDHPGIRRPRILAGA